MRRKRKRGMRKPKLSVVVPVYNTEKYLDKCLESITAQTMDDLEIICVNDGSTDGSLDILSAWAEADNRIKIYTVPNGGLGKALNFGFRHSNGEYLTEVDSDDWIDPRMYEKLLAVADGADIVKCGFYVWYGDESVPRMMAKQSRTICPRELKNYNLLKIFGFQPSFWSAIYRRDFIVKNDLWFRETHGASHQDTSAVFKATVAADKMVIVPECLYYWRFNHKHSVNDTKHPFSVLGEYEEMERFLNNKYADYWDLRRLLSRMRFDTYLWNYCRISDDFRLEFAIRASEHFKHDAMFQEPRYYGTQDWQVLCLWAENPKMFFEKMEVQKE